jgi:hypothetical protein
MWSGGMRHGQGRITYKDDSYFEGSWSNNIKSGSGTQTYMDEAGIPFGTYKGNFSNNKRNGEGTFTYASGEIVSGMWKDDSYIG